MRWVLVLVALLSFASRSVVADGPWGSNCPPGYHGVLNDNPESPDYGSVECVPDSPVNPGVFAIWWPVDPASVAAKVATAAAAILLPLLALVIGFVLLRRYVSRLSAAADADTAAKGAAARAWLSDNADAIRKSDLELANGYASPHELLDGRPLIDENGDRRYQNPFEDGSEDHETFELEVERQQDQLDDSTFHQRMGTSEF